MDEVLKIKKELEKTVPKNDTKRALELLKSLQSIPITLDVLQKTHIGFLVNKIRKSFDNPEVSSMSKGMVKKWKKLLPENQNPPSSGGNANNTTTSTHQISTNQPSSTHTTSESSSPANQQQTDHEHQQQPPQAKPTSPVTSASSTSEFAKPFDPALMSTPVPVTTSEVRLKCRQLLTDALKKPLPIYFQGESFHEEHILAARIEECIYQEFKSTDMKYKNRVRSRVANLSDPKNPVLKRDVLIGEVSVDQIAKMTAEEMASGELRRLREKYTKDAIDEKQTTFSEGTTTSEIKCPACKKYNVCYNQMQTRSADEPMTTFCFCNECGKRWKFC